MPPPGRRRLSPCLFSLFLLLLLSTASAASAVIGIDFGTEYIKAALVKPGIPLEIILTKDSKRKEAAVLAFKPSRQQTGPEVRPERLYGGDAVALAGRYPGDVYFNIKSLLGVPFEGSATERYNGNFPALRTELVIRNETSKAASVGLKSKILGEGEAPFMIEELMAMQLKNIKANADSAAGQGSDIRDVVMTIPAYYTVDERRALVFAAELAGLRVTSLMSDGLAVGLNYATTRTFPSVTDGAKPEYHLVYDMGAGSTTATVLRFQARSVKGVGKTTRTVQEIQVLGAKWLRTLGGDVLNMLIVKDMAGKLAIANKLDITVVDVLKHEKTMARLWKEAERMRQVLSANNVAYTSLEGIYTEETTFKYKLSRADFEALAAEVAPQTLKPLNEALAAAGISIDELNSVILHGGAVRTPFVQKALEAGVGSGKLKTNVNADEAAVLGAAFKAAQLSPSFRVKEIRAQDAAGYDIRLRWLSEGRERTQKLFTEKSVVGPEKEVPLKVYEDFAFEFSQKVGDQEVPVSEVTVSNLTASVARLVDKHDCVRANISTKFAILLSPIDGLPEVLSGSVSCEPSATKDGGVIDNVKGMFGFGKKASDEVPLGDEADISEDSSSTTATNASSTSKSTSASSAPSKSPTPSTVSIPLLISSRPLGLSVALSEKNLGRISKRLGEFDASDRNRVLRAEALNTLEAFTYKARDFVTDKDFKAYSPSSLADTLDKKLSETSDWLYGDGVDAPTVDFQVRLKDLKSLVDPVIIRQKEASGRKGAVDTLSSTLDHLKTVIDQVTGSIKKAAEDAKASSAAEATKTSEAASSSTATDEAEDLDDDPYPSSSTTAVPEPTPAFNPYTEADALILQSTYDVTALWLKEKVAAQDVLSTSEDPVLLLKDIEERAMQLQNAIRDVVVKNFRQPGKPKAKAKPKPKKKAKKAKGKGKSETPSGSKGSEESASSTTTATTADKAKGKGKGKGKAKGSSKKDEL